MPISSRCSRSIATSATLCSCATLKSASATFHLLLALLLLLPLMMPLLPLLLLLLLLLPLPSRRWASLPIPIIPVPIVPTDISFALTRAAARVGPYKAAVTVWPSPVPALALPLLAIRTADLGLPCCVLTVLGKRLSADSVVAAPALAGHPSL
jgi:hypothetical protein